MKIIDIIKIAINSSENLSKEKRDECIEYINNLHNKINKAIELNSKIDRDLRMKNTNAYIEMEDLIFEQYKILSKELNK